MRRQALLLLAVVSVWSVVNSSPQYDPAQSFNDPPQTDLTDPSSSQTDSTFPSPIQTPLTDSAMPSQPTATPLTTPGLPQTTPPMPQSSPTFPQTNPTLPQTNPSFPETNPTFPQTNPTFPQTNPTFPQTNPTFPQTNPTFPQTNPTFPQTNPTFPQTNPTFPQTNPTQPQTDDFYNNPSVASDNASLVPENLTSSEEAYSTEDSSEESWQEDQQDNQELQSSYTKPCYQEVELEDFCEDITTTARLYFDDSMSLESIINDVFSPQIVDKLLSCPNGTWCLPYEYHEGIKAAGEAFDDVYCKNVSDWSMRNCLNKMRTERPDCDDRVVDFVAKSINLLCDMWDASFMELECYTRAKKSLYVMFGQLEKEIPKDLDLSTCNNYLVNTFQTVMCADDACHFDQQRIFERFGPWQDMAIDSSYYMYKCNITRSACQGDEYPGNYYYDYNDYYSDEDDDYYNDYSSDDSAMDGLLEKILNTVKGGPSESSENGLVEEKASFDAGDKAIFLGLIAAVLVLSASFLLLLVFGYRRFRRGPNALPVYTKLATDDDITKAQFS